MKTIKDAKIPAQTTTQNTTAWQDNPDQPIVFENMEWVETDEAEVERRMIAHEADLARTESRPIRPIRHTTIVLCSEKKK
jgi:hypothetical protein